MIAVWAPTLVAVFIDQPQDDCTMTAPVAASPRGNSSVFWSAASSPMVLPGRCAAVGHDLLVAYYWKGRGVSPFHTSLRMVDTAAHRVDQALPSLPVRQRVLFVPEQLRSYLNDDKRRERPARAGAPVASGRAHGASPLMSSLGAWPDPLREAAGHCDGDPQAQPGLELEIDQRIARQLRAAEVARQAGHWRGDRRGDAIRAAAGTAWVQCVSHRPAGHGAGSNAPGRRCCCRRACRECGYGRC